MHTSFEWAGDVFPSLMPQGVEHFTDGTGTLKLDGVFPSLMPQGVEHSHYPICTPLIS